MKHLVVVGASLAGLRAAEAARRSGFDGPITLIGDELQLPYDRPPLSKAFLRGDVKATYFRTEEELASLRIETMLGTVATGLDTERREVTTSAGAVAFDLLVIATGASPRKVTGVPDLAGIRYLRTLDDAVALKQWLRPGAKVVILGAGFIGSEIASSAHHVGARAVVVEAASIPLVRAVGEIVGAALASLHARHGTRLLTQTRVVEYIGSGGKLEAVRLDTGERLPADVVVIGIGAAPATNWLVGSGLALDPVDGGVLCNEFMETSMPGVYAAGDVATWTNRAFGHDMRLENWTNAAAQGVAAGTNAVSGEARNPYEAVPYFWSDWYEQRIQFVGLPTADLVEFVSGGPAEERFLAIFRDGNRVVGAAALNEQQRIMKVRRIIASGGTAEAVRKLIQTAAAGASR